MLPIRRWLILFGMMVLLSNPAQALVLGNPSHAYKGGDFALSVALGDNREEIFGSIGIAESGVLDLFLAFEAVAPLEDREEFGVGYRHNLKKAFEMFDKPVQLGFLVQYRFGTIETPAGDFDLTTLVLGFGGAFSPLQDLNVYGAGLYERTTVEQNIPGFGVQDVSDTDTGLLVGVEYLLGESWGIGAEIRPALSDDDLIFYGRLKF